MAVELKTDMTAAFLEELAEGGDDLRRSVAKELKREAPVDTGALRSSIRHAAKVSASAARRGEVPLAAFTEVHGVVQNARGRHKGWIEKALGRAQRAFERG